MGAWGNGIFDDDLALDILDEFDDINDPFKYMQEALEDAIEADYLDYDVGINALVSSALIDAIVNEHDYPTLTHNYPYILKKISNLGLTKLMNNAAKALKQVISTKSELNSLWQESEEYKEWKTNIKEMIMRLDR